MSPLAVLRKTFGLRARNWMLVIGMLAALLFSVTTVGMSVALQRLIDAIGNWAGLLAAIRFGLIMVVARIVLLGLQTALIQGYAEGLLWRIRTVAAERLLGAEMASLDTYHAGDTISRLTHDAEKLGSFFKTQLVQVFLMPLTGVLAFIYMASIDLRLTLLMIAGLPLVGAVTNRIGGPIGGLSQAAQEKMSRAMEVASDATNSFEVVKTYGLQPAVGSLYRDQLGDARGYLQRAWSRQAWVLWVTISWVIVPYAVLFGLGAAYVVTGQLTIGQLLAILTLVEAVTQPITRLLQVLAQARADLAAGGRVVELLDITPERQTTEGQHPPTPRRGGLVMKQVSFGYPGRAGKILEDLDLAVADGEHVAIAGRSGSGKTTILRLLVGLYPPDAGEVVVFGRSLADWDPAELRWTVMLLGQEPLIYPGTIFDNIALAKPGASPEEVQRAADEAGLSQMLAGHPTGLETVVGEQGVSLSGGQQQLVAIARAALRGPPVLLLDEPTAALDPAVEDLVLESLTGLFRQQTVITITHRHETLRAADRILVVEDGRVVEQGSYGSLAQKAGAFAAIIGETETDPQGREA